MLSHSYVDETEMYVPISYEDSSIQGLVECLQEVKERMGQNKLKLNEGKTEVLLILPNMLKSEVE